MRGSYLTCCDSRPGIFKGRINSRAACAFVGSQLILAGKEGLKVKSYRLDVKCIWVALRVCSSKLRDKRIHPGPPDALGFRPCYPGPEQPLETESAVGFAMKTVRAFDVLIQSRRLRRWRVASVGRWIVKTALAFG